MVANGLIAFGRQAGGEGDAVLLGNADVEGTLRKLLLEQVDAGARRHRRGDGDDLVVLARFLDQALAVDLLIGGRGRLRLDLRAGGDVELDDAVILVGGFLRRRVALALLRDDVNEDRPVLHVAHVFQNRQQMIDVVAVDRADIEEAELVEQRAAGDQPARVLLDRDRALLAAFCSACAWRSGGRSCAGGDSRARRRAAPDRRTARRPAARSTCRCR